MLSLDVRHFKLINDLFGSDQGDLVLKYIHDSIKSQLHNNEFVSRISSDTFNLVLNTVDKDEVENWLHDTVDRINNLNLKFDTPYYLNIDCGVFLVTEDYVNVGLIAIRDRTNSARKNNKQGEDNKRYTCNFYNDCDRLRMIHEQEMENAAERALEYREFVVYLQPKVDIITGKIAGAEALSRWQIPGKELIFPGNYIPLFEKNGFVCKLDLYVFEETCILLRKWIDSGKTPIPISFNLSRCHLRSSHFLDEFKKIQMQYNIQPELIEFELTETVVFENLKLLKQVVEEIHRYGFKCSMDDFGSGYSSLNVLKEINVDTLKLDREFFLQENDERSKDIVQTVILLAKKLGMLTVSEGIESQTQVDFLRSAGCNLVQGHVFSKPISIKEFEIKAFAENGLGLE